MYHLATIHIVTDGRTCRHTDPSIMPIIMFSSMIGKKILFVTSRQSVDGMHCVAHRRAYIVRGRIYFS